MENIIGKRSHPLRTIWLIISISTVGFLSLVGFFLIPKFVALKQSNTTWAPMEIVAIVFALIFPSLMLVFVSLARLSIAAKNVNLVTEWVHRNYDLALSKHEAYGLSTQVFASHHKSDRRTYVSKNVPIQISKKHYVVRLVEQNKEVFLETDKGEKLPFQKQS